MTSSYNRTDVVLGGEPHGINFSSKAGARRGAAASTIGADATFFGVLIRLFSSRIFVFFFPFGIWQPLLQRSIFLERLFRIFLEPFPLLVFGFSAEPRFLDDMTNIHKQAAIILVFQVRSLSQAFNADFGIQECALKRLLISSNPLR